MATPWLTLVLLLSVFYESNNLMWKPKALEPDASVIVCNSHDLLLGWKYDRESDETLDDVRWFFNGDNIAKFNKQGMFVNASQFHGRVTKKGNAGLIVSVVTSLDTGNYSVQVSTVSDSGKREHLTRTAFVLVKDGLMTRDGTLHAQEDPKAVFVQATQAFHVVLTCGPFSYPDSPPFEIMWTMPNKQTVLSSDYKDGQFRLLLDNPVMTGTYTCRVPDRSKNAACIHDNSGDVSTNVTVYALSILVKRLEAEIGVLREKVKQGGNCSSSNSDSEAQMNQSEASLSQTTDVTASPDTQEEIMNRTHQNGVCGGLVCENGGTLNRFSCVCVCLPVWKGETCTTPSCIKQDLLDQCTSSSFYAEYYCGGSHHYRDKCPLACGVCSAEGLCGGKVCPNGGSLNVDNCTCKCPPLWMGEDCDTLICPESETQPFCSRISVPLQCPLRNNREQCPIRCGVCNKQSCGDKRCQNGGSIDATTCTCKCTQLWTGDDCTTLKCPQKDFAQYCLYSNLDAESQCTASQQVREKCPIRCRICPEPS